ncbi:CD8A protein, partial [Eudromia elegans]|nr:CD8A protein [Eudromia elegans]
VGRGRRRHLPLSAGCGGTHGQRGSFAARFRDSRMAQPLRGQRLALECRPADSDVGVSWIRQDPGGALHFIAFINTLARVTYKGSEQTSTHFGAAKEGGSFQLVVKSFSERDQGTYFCLVNKNQMLHFSTGQAAFLPGQQHLCLLCPSPAPYSRPSLGISPSLSPTPAGSSEEKRLDFTCSIFIWIPLACGCLVLLLALVVTVAVCQSKGPRSTPRRGSSLCRR